MKEIRYVIIHTHTFLLYFSSIVISSYAGLSYVYLVKIHANKNTLLNKISTQCVTATDVQGELQKRVQIYIELKWC